MGAASASVHASAVLIGARAVLIRGPAGAGKSRLAFDLLQAAAGGQIPFARLVADDRVLLEVHHGRLLARPAPTLAGLLEVRGLGIRRLAHEPLAVIGWVVDLGVQDTERLPLAQAQETVVASVTLPRFAVHPCADPRVVLLAALGTSTA